MPSHVYPHLEVCGPYPDPDAGDVFWRSDLTGEIRSAILATRVEYPVAYPLLPSSLEENLFVGDLVYEYLARETNGASGPYFPDRSVDSPLVDYTHSGFATPPIIMSSPPFSLTSPSPSLPQETPSPLRGGQPPPEPRCRQGTPSFDRVQRKWSCTVCTEFFRDKYECERHIENVGKRMKCLACGKVVCGRRDSRKRHYIKYCKRVDLGHDGGLRFEDAFIEVYGSST